MKIRMLTGISGVDFNLIPKEETERFSDGEAVRLMTSDQAEPADAEAAAALAEAREREVADYEGRRLIEAGQAERVETDEERDARLETERKAATAAADAAAAELKKAEDDAAAKAAADAEAKAKDLGAARKAYRAAFGKGAGPSWSIEQIAAKIAEKQG